MPSQLNVHQAIGSSSSSNHAESSSNNNNNNNSLTNSIRETLSQLFGKLAKGVVYSGAQLARLNNRLLCTFLTHESEPDNEDQPTLYVFNDVTSMDRAFRIYADDEINLDMLREAQFDSTQMTIFLVHGWLGGIHNELWLSEAKNVALKHSKANEDDNNLFSFKPNVVVVDWSDLALGSLYTATQNSRKVSTRLARLFRELAFVGNLKPQLMHCIGHSIGLHICGRAAREAFPQPASSKANLSQLMAWNKFGRISGVDPGGFCYELDIRGSESSFEGMRPSDALLTDAYYTNRSPFGNKFQVAQFNVRVNDAFFQRACSVWKNPEIAREYFQATVRFLMGNTGHNDLLTCDHYFATKLAAQSLQFEQTNETTLNSLTNSNELSCSLLAYSCQSHSDFIRGRCGLCRRNSPLDCYPMDFEYQRARPSIQHAWSHLERYTNFTRQADDIDRPVAAGGPTGSIAYEKRSIYYMRYNGTDCSRLFRLRVQFYPPTDFYPISAGLQQARLLDKRGQAIEMFDPLRNKLVDAIRLHGPWQLWKQKTTDENENENEQQDLDSGEWQTALIEVPREQLSLESFVRQIDQIFIEPAARNATSTALINQIAAQEAARMHLDYLTSTSRR